MAIASATPPKGQGFGATAYGGNASASIRGIAVAILPSGKCDRAAGTVLVSLRPMSPLVRRHLTPSEVAPALRALAGWTPADAPTGGVHPGDIGWYLRFDDATVLLWLDESDAPVAVGFVDGAVLRVTTAPEADLGALAADARQVLRPGIDGCDGFPIPGWRLDGDEPWAVMSWRPRPVSSRAGFVGEADVADRVLVHCAAFARYTFTADRRRAMMASPAGGMAVDVLVRTPSGEPASGATGWFAGVGRCGLLEPVGTHSDHRGHGYGREAVLGACAAMADRGASAVAVVTPAANTAAVALYRSAGFTVLRENHDWVRPELGTS